MASSTRRPWTNADEKELMELHQSSWDLDRIASHFGRSAKAIEARIKVITRLSRTDARSSHTGKRWSEADNEKLWHLANDLDLPLTEIADKLERTVIACHKRFQDMKVSKEIAETPKRKADDASGILEAPFSSGKKVKSTTGAIENELTLELSKLSGNAGCKVPDTSPTNTPFQVTEPSRSPLISTPCARNPSMPLPNSSAPKNHHPNRKQTLANHGTSSAPRPAKSSTNSESQRPETREKPASQRGYGYSSDSSGPGSSHPSPDRPSTKGSSRRHTRFDTELGDVANNKSGAHEARSTRVTFQDNARACSGNNNHSAIILDSRRRFEGPSKAREPMTVMSKPSNQPRTESNHQSGADINSRRSSTSSYARIANGPCRRTTDEQRPVTTSRVSYRPNNTSSGNEFEVIPPGMDVRWPDGYRGRRSARLEKQDTPCAKFAQCRSGRCAYNHTICLNWTRGICRFPDGVGCKRCHGTVTGPTAIAFASTSNVQHGIKSAHPSPRERTVASAKSDHEPPQTVQNSLRNVLFVPSSP